jgi:hypothetical protein
VLLGRSTIEVVELTESKAQIAAARDEIAGLIKRIKQAEPEKGCLKPVDGDRDAAVPIAFRLRPILITETSTPTSTSVSHTGSSNEANACME